MKFKRINVDTVRCIITENELNENGLEIEDFMHNDGRAEEFLRKVVSLAEEEVGFHVQGGPLSVQVAVLPEPEHSVALTFSEKPENNLLNLLQNLKNAMDNLSGNLAAGKKSTDEADEEDTLLGGDSKNRIYLLGFHNLEEIITYAKAIVLEEPIVSSVYRIQEQTGQKYYLMIERNGLGDKEICRVISASVEFMVDASSEPGKASYILEHGTCIIEKDALEILQKL